LSRLFTFFATFYRRFFLNKNAGEHCKPTARNTSFLCRLHIIIIIIIIIFIKSYPNATYTQINNSSYNMRKVNLLKQKIDAYSL